MPLIKSSSLPTYDRLLAEGRQVLTKERAQHQDIRELHIGLLNIMPDAALEATERQFFRLVCESNSIAQINMHPFTLPVFERGKEAMSHINAYYETFESIQAQGLDGLIITGANEETNPHVSDVTTWKPLKDAIAWAYDNVTSTICSCLASHAVMTYGFDDPPAWREDKRWGVFRHQVRDKNHPLVRGMNTVFDVPHSRYSEITPEQFTRAGMRILAESPTAGVHIAASKDGFRQICFQGHPEYDTFSLLKEYKREVTNYITGVRPDYPPPPDDYFNNHAKKIAEDHRARVLSGDHETPFPEDALEAYLENTWADSARSLIASWIGLIYQITDVDRKKPFMPGIDPRNPLQL